jgi:hypothetical protein
VNNNNGLTTTPQEEMLLVHLGLLGVLAVLGAAGALWLKGATWLVEHQVLVPSAHHPMVEIPGTGSAGLDLPRLAIVVAALLAGLAIAFSAAYRAIRRRRLEVS